MANPTKKTLSSAPLKKSSKAASKKTQKKIGRPSTYSKDLALDICVRLAEGSPLTRICRAPNMPTLATVYRWLADERYAEFRDMYARAREDQADTLADEIIEISDDGSNDTYVDANGNEKVDNDVVQRSKLRVDARKWVAAKLRPRKYGDKVTNELTGADGKPLEITTVDAMTAEEKVAHITNMLAMAKARKEKAERDKPQGDAGDAS